MKAFYFTLKKEKINPGHNILANNDVVLLQSQIKNSYQKKAQL